MEEVGAVVQGDDGDGGTNAVPLRPSSKLAPHLAGFLAVVLSNKMWTEDRKYSLGLVQTNNCRVCALHGIEAEDTLLHRNLHCKGVLEEQGFMKFHWVQALATNIRVSARLSGCPSGFTLGCVHPTHAGTEE